MTQDIKQIIVEMRQTCAARKWVSNTVLLDNITAILDYVERLREALKFYATCSDAYVIKVTTDADGETIIKAYQGDKPAIMFDGGERARKALEGEG